MPKYLTQHQCSLSHPSEFRSEIQPLYEFRASEFVAAVSSFLRTRERAAFVYSYYLGVTKRGILRFRVSSGTTPGLYWQQRIELSDLSEAIRQQSRDRTMTNVDVVNLAVFGDVKFHCNCPAFHYYGFQYIATELDSALKREVRPPTIRNPNLEGTVCKHLYQVLRRLPMHITVIARDMVKVGLLKELPSRSARALSDAHDYQ